MVDESITGYQRRLSICNLQLSQGGVRVFGILYRMIFWELVKVFVLSLVGITGILVLAGIVADASRQGLGPAQILAIVPLLVPSLLPYSIPTTALFASCIVYGRLSADNEILAIKAAGINLLKVVGPVALFGLLISGATMALYHSFIPSTFHRMRSFAMSDVEEFLYTLLRTEGQIKQPNLKYFMWVHRVQGRRLLYPVFKKLNDKGSYDLVAVAKEANLRYVPSKNEIEVHMWNGDVYQEGSTARFHFDERLWEVPMQSLDRDKKRRPREMTWPELEERRLEVLKEDEDLAREIALVAARLLINQPPAVLTQHLENLKIMRHQKYLEVYSIDAEMQMRPAIAFGCLFFVLVGCPVGIWFSRSDYLSSFITCFLPIVAIYYPVLLCGTNLAKDGRLPAYASLWAADAAMALGALVLFRRLLRN
jgi:lipopolysaccharide export system permease protein